MTIMEQHGFLKPVMRKDLLAWLADARWKRSKAGGVVQDVRTSEGVTLPP